MHWSSSGSTSSRGEGLVKNIEPEQYNMGKHMMRKRQKKLADGANIDKALGPMTGNSVNYATSAVLVKSAFPYLLN